MRAAKTKGQSLSWHKSAKLHWLQYNCTHCTLSKGTISITFQCRDRSYTLLSPLKTAFLSDNGCRFGFDFFVALFWMLQNIWFFSRLCSFTFSRYVCWFSSAAAKNLAAHLVPSQFTSTVSSSATFGGTQPHNTAVCSINSFFQKLTAILELC